MQPLQQVPHMMMPWWVQKMPGEFSRHILSSCQLKMNEFMWVLYIYNFWNHFSTFFEDIISRKKTSTWEVIYTDLLFS